METTVRVKGHTKVVNGKLVWVPAHDRHVEHALDDDFDALLANPKLQEHAQTPEPKQEPEDPKGGALEAFPDLEADFQALEPKLKPHMDSTPEPAPAAPAPEPEAKATTGWTPNGKDSLIAKWTGHNYTEGHDKVYQLQIVEGPDKKFHVLAKWGKTGGSVTQADKGAYETEEKAMVLFHNIQNQKLKGGYATASHMVAQAVTNKGWSQFQIEMPAAPKVETPKAGAVQFGDIKEGDVFHDGATTLEAKFYKYGDWHFTDGEGNKVAFDLEGWNQLGAVKQPGLTEFASLTAGMSLQDKENGEIWTVLGKSNDAIHVDGPEGDQWTEAHIWDSSYAPYLIETRAKKPEAPTAKPTPAPSILDWKTGTKSGTTAQYGSLQVTFKMDGTEPTLRIHGPGAEFDADTMEALGADWMPIAKQWKLKLQGLPWAGGKAKTKQLHDALTALGHEASAAAPAAPAPEPKEGEKVPAKQVKPGMTFKVPSGTTYNVIKIHPGGGIEVQDLMTGQTQTVAPKYWDISSTIKYTNGPKVGDTKVENGKTYILNANHRWQLEDEVVQELEDAFDKLANAGSVTKLASGITIGMGKQGGKPTLRVFSNGLNEDQKEAFKAFGFNGVGTGYFWKKASEVDWKATAKILAVTGTPAKGPAHPAAEPEQPAAEPVQVADVGFPFKQIGPQAGSNEGGLYEDALGKKWYIKFPASEDHAKNEALAAKFYEVLGIPVPKVKLVKKGGKVGIASRFLDGLHPAPGKLSSAPGAAEGFAVDAWLGNWDAVGLNSDNMLLDGNGRAYRIDPGGALLFRAQGVPKGEAFVNTVPEIKTLRDASANPSAAKVFGKMTKAQLQDSVVKVLELPDEVITEAVQKFGPGNAADKAALAKKLIARKADLAKQFPTANAIANPPKPDPSAIPVPANSFPKAPNFANWEGTGKGLSSNETINTENQKAADAIYAAATAGNLTALKAMTTTPVGGTAPIPMGQHKSQHIRAMFSQCIETLEELAAGKGKKHWDLGTLDGSSLAEICAAAKSYQYGATKSSVPAGKKLGFWLKIGDFAGAEAFAPKQEHWVNNADREKGKASVAKIPTILRKFMKAVKSSGSANDPYRYGAEFDHNGNKCRDVIEAAYKHAVEFSEGTKITKHIDLESGMAQAFAGMKPGHIFQNPGSMCTSLKQNWNWSGEVHMEIIYAKGAKALYNIGVGNFDSEGEVTTLPGQRFMLLKWDDKGGNGGKKHLKVLMLPPDENYVNNLKTAKAAA